MAELGHGKTRSMLIRPTTSMQAAGCSAVMTAKVHSRATQERSPA